MALDEAHRRLFVAARKPARLLVLDMDTRKEIASLPGAIDTDDLAFDPDRKRTYVTSASRNPTAIGARTSAYTGQVGKHNSFYLAVPARADRGAERGSTKLGIKVRRLIRRCHWMSRRSNTPRQVGCKL